MRPAIARAVRAAALALALAGQGAAETPRAAVLTLDEAYIVARQAYASGDPALAYAIARRLLQADPQDARALLLVAAVAPLLGEGAEGLAAGQAAWRAAQGKPLLRYEVARFTARAALASDRPGAAQLWLRRAADLAPDPQAAAQTARDYADLRKARRFTWGLDVSVTPTDNVNGGASGDVLTVNDSLPIGVLSGDAQALAGTRAALSARAVWTLPDGPARSATIGLRAYATAHRLTGDARAQAPAARGGAAFDFAVAEATGSLTLRPAALPGPLRLTVGAGQSWYGGDLLGPHLRGEAGISLLERSDRLLRFSVGAERQWRDEGLVDARILRLDGGVALAQAGRLMVGLSVSAVTGEAPNGTYGGATLEASFIPARPLGPVALQLGASVGVRTWDFYRLGPFGVPDGRQDVTATLDLQAGFPDLSRFGYMPVVTLSAERTRSNISRFDTRTLGITFGLSSQF